MNADCMSLSPLVSFKLRFVTYLLNFSRKCPYVSWHLLPDRTCKLVTCLILPTTRSAAYWIIDINLILAQGYVRLFPVNMFCVNVYIARSDSHENRLRDFMNKRIS